MCQEFRIYHKEPDWLTNFHHSSPFAAKPEMDQSFSAISDNLDTVVQILFLRSIKRTDSFANHAFSSTKSYPVLFFRHEWNDLHSNIEQFE